MTGLTCRGCGASDLQIVLSLGKMPPSNALLTQAQLAEPEPRYPLELAFCEACALAQITVSVDPEELFGEYAYFSSYSTTMLAHAETLVAADDRGAAPRTREPRDGDRQQRRLPAPALRAGRDPGARHRPGAERGRGRPGARRRDPLRVLRRGPGRGAPCLGSTRERAPREQRARPRPRRERSRDGHRRACSPTTAWR